MRRSATIAGGTSSVAQLSSEVAEREAALTEQLAAAEARAGAAVAEREAIKRRVLQLETELRQKDKAVEEAAAAAAGGRDKQVRAFTTCCWLLPGLFCSILQTRPAAALILCVYVS